MRHPVVASAYQKAVHLFGVEQAVPLLPLLEAYPHQLNGWSRAATTNQRRVYRRAQHITLTPFAARVTALLQSTKRQDGFTLERLMDEASSLDVARPIDELVVARAKRKPGSPELRPILSFGPLRKAQQTICAHTLRAAWNVEPFNYLAKRRGSDRASDRIVALVDDGFRHFTIADITNFFGSVQQERIGDALEDTLPAAAIEHSIVLSREAVLLTDISLHETLSYRAFDEAARSGLPQGSRASNLVASLLLGPMLRTIASVDRCVLYGDDVLVAHRSEEQAVALSKALPEVLASHPAGPFRLKRCEVTHIRRGFDFLGYHFVLRTSDVDVHRRPSWKSYERYGEKVSRIAQFEPEADVPLLVNRYLGRWIRAFPRWPHNIYSRGLLAGSTDEAIDVGWNRRYGQAAPPSLKLSACPIAWPEEAGNAPLTPLVEGVD